MESIPKKQIDSAKAEREIGIPYSDKTEEELEALGWEEFFSFYPNDPQHIPLAKEEINRISGRWEKIIAKAEGRFGEAGMAVLMKKLKDEYKD